MKVNLTIKITPDPDKDGKQEEPKTLEAQVEMSPGFGNLFPIDGVADIAREYAKSKLNEEPVNMRPGFIIDDEEEYISTLELEEFRNWKKSQKTE